MISVPFITQNGNNDRNDCGRASVAMVASAYTGKRITIAQVADVLQNKDRFTSIPQVIAGLRAFSVQATNTREGTWEWHCEKLDAGVPVISLVDYRAYSHNPARYVFAHLLVCLGYDSRYVYVNDPLRNEGGTTIPRAEFIRSIDTPSAYIGGFNFAHQAVYPTAPLVAPIPVIPTYAREAIAGMRHFGGGLRETADAAAQLEGVA